MVHADNQYDPALVGEMVEPILAGRADMVIGSRLLEDRAIAGGMPRWKWLGNRLLTGIENRAFGVSFSEYHTGYRAFSAPLLRSIAFLRNSDEFVFDQQIFAQVIARDARVVEIPIPTRYFREASSVDFGTSVRYAPPDDLGPRAVPRAPSAACAATPCCCAPEAPGDARPGGAARSGARCRRWSAAAVILAAAFAIRLAYVDATPGMKLVARRARLRRPRGLDRAVATATRHSPTARPTAFRPPGYPYLLAAVYKAAGVERAAAPGASSSRAARRSSSAPCSSRRSGWSRALLWGPVAALVAMGLAAVYVPLVTMSGTVMSEPLFASSCSAGSARRSPPAVGAPLAVGGGSPACSRASRSSPARTR